MLKKIKNVIEIKIEEIVRKEIKKISNIQKMEVTFESEKVVKGCNSDIAIFKNRFELLDYSITKANRQSNNELILEFGVYKGVTINFIATKISNHAIFGFDSFEGLPEKWREGFEQGIFKLEKLPDVRKNIELIKGYFEDTLPEFLDTHTGNVSILHVDCDLYSSTKCIFENLASRIRKGTIIIFDEFFNYPEWEEGEYKAWNEFVQKHEVKFEIIGYVDGDEQLAVIIL